ncbi:MAG: CCA tRNA nucleotidyltransferase [Candidatus Njordarchaeia archaeon]
MDVKLASLKKCKDINNEICLTIKKIVNKIIPNEIMTEKVLVDSKRIVREIDRFLLPLKKKFGFDRIEMHGSVAKGTWLPDRIDLDIFIIYTELKSKEILQDFVKEIPKLLPFKSSLRYAEHPYVRLYNVYGYNIDLVPAFDLGGKEFYSATDRSIYHTRFINENMDDVLRNEVRLLKSFLIGVNSYGAEIKIGGFSGYATELLTLHYKTFIDVLLALEKENEIFITFTEKSSNRDKLFEKFQSKFIILDPVDPNRNVAAALRPETFYRTKLASKLFLQKPNTYFFHIQKEEDLVDYRKQIRYDEERNITIIEIEFNPEVPPDKSWGIVLKIIRDLKKNVEIKELDPIYIGAEEKENTIYILIETVRDKQHKYRKIIGPPVTAPTKHILEFIKKHKNSIAGPWLEKERLYALETRPTKTITQIIKNSISQYTQRHRKSIKTYRIHKIKHIEQIDETLAKLITRKEKWLKTE